MAVQGSLPCFRCDVEELGPDEETVDSASLAVIAETFRQAGKQIVTPIVTSVT